MFHAPEDHLSSLRAWFSIPGARGLDSCFLESPGLDSGFLGPHGLDSDFLGHPELELDLLGASCAEFWLPGLYSGFLGWIPSWAGFSFMGPAALIWRPGAPWWVLAFWGLLDWIQISNVGFRFFLDEGFGSVTFCAGI